MELKLLAALLLPFAGTIVGSGSVLFTKNDINMKLQRIFTGFAAGVMVAASVWSLIIPSLEQSEGMGVFSFVPAAAGFWMGILLLLLMDHVIPHLHLNSEKSEGPESRLPKRTKMLLAVTIHNIPEGMAVGIVFAGYISEDTGMTLSGALILASGIAMQNIPEGAIISIPLRASGVSRKKAFLYGTMSGIVEPAGAALMIAASGLFVPVLPYLLALAAGAMIYVVVEELIPEMSQGDHSNLGTCFFAVGFTLMMILDVALG